jgi:hypothetical protein
MPVPEAHPEGKEAEPEAPQKTEESTDTVRPH